MAKLSAQEFIEKTKRKEKEELREEFQKRFGRSSAGEPSQAQAQKEAQRKAIQRSKKIAEEKRKAEMLEKLQQARDIKQRGIQEKKQAFQRFVREKKAQSFISSEIQKQKIEQAKRDLPKFLERKRAEQAETRRSIAGELLPTQFEKGKDITQQRLQKEVFKTPTEVVFGKFVSEQSEFILSPFFKAVKDKKEFKRTLSRDVSRVFEETVPKGIAQTSQFAFIGVPLFAKSLVKKPVKTLGETLIKAPSVIGKTAEKAVTDPVGFFISAKLATPLFKIGGELAKPIVSIAKTKGVLSLTKKGIKFRKAPKPSVNIQVSKITTKRFGDQGTRTGKFRITTTEGTVTAGRLKSVFKQKGGDVVDIIKVRTVKSKPSKLLSKIAGAEVRRGKITETFFRTKTATGGVGESLFFSTGKGQQLGIIAGIKKAGVEILPTRKAVTIGDPFFTKGLEKVQVTSFPETKGVLGGITKAEAGFGISKVAGKKAVSTTRFKVFDIAKDKPVDFFRSGGKVVTTGGELTTKQVTGVTLAGVQAKVISQAKKDILSKPTTGVTKLQVVPVLESKQRTKTFTTPKFIQSDVTKTASITGVKQKVRFREKEKPIVGVTEVFSPIQTTRQAQITLVAEKTGQRQKQKLKLVERTKTGTKTTFTTPTQALFPLVPVVADTSPTRQQFARKRFGFKILPAFEVQVRRGGKFRTVGKPLPFGRAKRLGTRVTTGTLGQTFRLLPKGRTTKRDIPFNIPTDIFTSPKKRTSPLEFVERRGKTLKRGTGEIPEIQLARKRAKKKVRLI